MSVAQDRPEVPESSRLLVGIGAVAGGAGVVLGAFGAHALKERLLATGRLEAWETAVLYLLLHAVALVAVGAASGSGVVARAAARRVGACWVGGIVLFSGSIVVLALGGPRWLGPVTPLGGLLLVAGWGLLALGVRKAV